MRIEISGANPGLLKNQSLAKSWQGMGFTHKTDESRVVLSPAFYALKAWRVNLSYVLYKI
jgi:hypothetical protein